MFPRRYFPARFFAPRYFPIGGGVVPFNPSGIAVIDGAHTMRMAAAKTMRETAAKTMELSAG